MSQIPVTAANAAQIDYWNTSAGETWVARQAQLDRQLAIFGQQAIGALAPEPGGRLLDIGCGCGDTTLQLAARVGSTGAVVGVDISAPMLDVARRRPVPPGAAAPEFRMADAQVADLGAGGFDGAFSRFGVMFFADPTAAFRNIRAALKPGGRLAFVCWRPFEHNPWMREPMAAAAPLLPPQPPPDPTAPGPFAFADDARVRRILGEAGFSDIAVHPFDASIGGSSVAETVELTLRVGPLGRLLREMPDKTDSVVAAVRAAIVPYDTPEGVFMPSAVWIVSALA